MSKSLKTNFIFNFINTVSGLLFPVITFPYISRVIMAGGIGQVQFYNSIINYIVLFSSLGIPLYGIREIARVRDNQEALNRTVFEILSLNLILNIVGYLVVFILCSTVSRIYENIPLFLILSLSIILNTIGCSWFYSGIEDYKYIAIRGICIKIISILFLFFFVKSQNDLLEYGFYTVFGSVGNNILNFIKIRKYLNFGYFKFSNLNIKRHIKPAFSIFIFNIITSIYLNLDKVMLGFIKGDVSVGYYTAATNLSQVLLYSVTSLGAVLLPRASNLINNNKFAEFEELSLKAYHFVLFLSIPIVSGCILLAKPLIHLFCGPDFEPSILTLKLISPIIIFIGMSNLIGMLILYPLGKIKIVTISTCVGAIMNIILNSILIPFYSQYGAAFSTVLSEFSVTLTQIIIGISFVPFKILDRKIGLYLTASILAGLFSLFGLNLISGDLLQIIVVTSCFSSFYLAFLYYFGDKLVLELFVTIKKYIKL
jgi:O-antigen/teichoic acid export membrane protein